MASFNREDPLFQRAQQRASAKRLNGPRTLDRGRETAVHADYQLGRQLQFERIMQGDKSSKISHDLRMSRISTSGKLLGLREDELDDQKSGLKWTIASGILGSGLSVLEGQRREKLEAEERYATESARIAIEDNTFQKRNKQYKKSPTIAGLPLERAYR